MDSVMALFILVLPFVLGNVSDISPEADIDLIRPSAPEIKAVYSPLLHAPLAGQQLVIATTLTNNDDIRDWAAVDLIEVRDSSGITVSLYWQSGISAGGTMDVGASWIPEYPDNYEVRTFVISSLDNPRIFSQVERTPISIGP
jgi:hypothetical protein